MLFDFESAGPSVGDALMQSPNRSRWRVDSEYGRLVDVMMSAPPHIELVPCNSVSMENHRNGVTCSSRHAG